MQVVDLRISTVMRRWTYECNDATALRNALASGLSVQRVWILMQRDSKSLLLTVHACEAQKTPLFNAKYQPVFNVEVYLLAL